MKIIYACLLALALLWLPRQARASGESVASTSHLILHTSPAPHDTRVPTTMSQGFEGAWPAPGWTVLQQGGAPSGTYLLGKRACHPRSGSFAGWTVGGGTQGGALPCESSFPNSVETWAIYGPFDLTYATRAALDVYLWGRTEVAPECGADYLFIGSSYDGTNYAGRRYCDDWTQGNDGNGYFRRTLDLSHYLGQSQVWVAVAFASNASGTDIGFVVDDLALDVEFSGGARRAHLPLLLKVSGPPVGPTPTPTVRPPTYAALVLYPHGDYRMQPSAQAAQESIAINPAAASREWSYDLTGDIQGRFGTDVTLQTYFSNACFRLAFYRSNGAQDVLLTRSDELCVANETKRFIGTLEGIDPAAQPGDRLLFRITHSSGAYGNALIGGLTNAHIQLMAQE